MATFSGIQHIGEKVFNFVPNENILNCRMVCKSWKQILDNPKLWLKKLNDLGQTKKVNKACLTLLRKASKAELLESQIINCLIVKYMKVREFQKTFFMEPEKTNVSRFLLKLPLLYFAMIPKEPDLDLLSFLIKSEKEIMKSIKCPTNKNYIRGHVFISVMFRDYEIDPVRDAILGKNAPEVIELLQSEFKRLTTSEVFHRENLYHLNLAVDNGNVEACKILIKHFESYEEKDLCLTSLIKKSIFHGNLGILECLISVANNSNFDPTAG